MSLFSKLFRYRLCWRLVREREGSEVAAEAAQLSIRRVALLPIGSRRTNPPMTPHMRYLAGRLGKRGDAADANPNQKCRLVPGGAGSPLRGWYHHEGDQRGASRGPSGEREARGGHSSRLVFGDSGRGLVIRSRVKASSNLLSLLPIHSGRGLRDQTLAPQLLLCCRGLGLPPCTLGRANPPISAHMRYL